MFEKVFNDYVDRFDFLDKDILLKYNHSYRVRNLAIKYAILLNYCDDDLKLAEFIGLYHDIGRFNQIRDYHDYDDNKSIDHAEEGIRVLFEEGLINKFNFTEEEKEIIEFAIRNHNKYEIENIDDKRKMMHAKLIRDCDKLDIVYLFGHLKEKNVKLIDEPLDDEIKNSFYNHKILKYNDSPNCQIIGYFAFVFDINNDIILNEFKYYLNCLYRRLNNENVLKEIYELANNYLESRLENVRN